MPNDQILHGSDIDEIEALVAQVTQEYDSFTNGFDPEWREAMRPERHHLMVATQLLRDLSRRWGDHEGARAFHLAHQTLRQL